jgi:hypothetical protein
VGRLLGHTHAGTTQRYAHLAEDSLRTVTNDFIHVLVTDPKQIESGESNVNRTAA